MRRPDPLPAAFRDRIFTRTEAVGAGLSPERLRRRDIERVSRGAYRWIEGLDSPQDVGRDCHVADVAEGIDVASGVEVASGIDVAARNVSMDGGREAGSAGLSTGGAPTATENPGRRVHPTLPRAAAVLDAIHDACASHLTAALLRGWWLPKLLADSATVHVIRPRTRPRINRRDVITHRTDLDDLDFVRVQGRLVTSVERTWLDCASLMALEDLIVLGDYLVRRPRRWSDARQVAWTTVSELHACLVRYPGRSGIAKARAALELMRVGSDSPQESLLRLAMHAADLPEPELQVECWDPDYSLDFPATADLGYSRWKIAIQYEGEHHGSPAQMARDLRRDQAFIRQGWTVLRFGSADSREGFRAALHLISQALRSAQTTEAASRAAAQNAEAASRA